MIDISSIAALVSSLNSLRELVGAAHGLRDSVKLASVEAELTRQITTALSAALKSQQEMFALQQEVERLQKSITELQNWEATAKSYQLQEVGSGTHAYAIDPPVQGTKPAVYFCPNCFTDRKLLPLQRQVKSFQGFIRCNTCGLEIADGTFEDPSF